LNETVASISEVKLEHIPAGQLNPSRKITGLVNPPYKPCKVIFADLFSQSEEFTKTSSYQL
jgi:hypothetical protein